MPAIKVLANLFASLQNSEMRHKKERVSIPPRASREALTVLQKRRYIRGFQLSVPQVEFPAFRLGARTRAKAPCSQATMISSFILGAVPVESCLTLVVAKSLRF
jgi:ribosomal protein S8